jgi:hypothetical protein
MNPKQRIILAIVGILLALMLSYPPFHHTISGRNFGYSWIFDPPHEFASVNVATLLVQWICVTAVGAIAFLFCGNDRGHNRAHTAAHEVSEHSSKPLEKRIRPLRSATVATVIGMCIGSLGFSSSPLCSTGVLALPCIVGMGIAAVFWASLSFAVVFSVQYLRAVLQRRKSSIR